MATVILGISAFYHDSAACVLVDGSIVAAAQQERFSRVKFDARFPYDAVSFVLNYAGLSPGDVDTVVFYDKPMLKFERLLETYHAFAPRGLASFVRSMPIWVGQKLFMRRLLQKNLKRLGFDQPHLLFPEHHLSHASAAFYPSPFESAAVLTVDGVGEWATATICHGRGNEMRILRQLEFPHSLGLLYAAFTAYCGFKVNSGEYKLMGLAPYADRNSDEVRRIAELILNELVDLRDDGSFLLNMEYFGFATGLSMFDRERWRHLFGLAPRSPEGKIDSGHMAMAAAIQQVTEEVVMRMAKSARDLTGESRICLSGGVALNCVVNGELLRSGLFDQIWIQPAAGDAGGALGAALAGWFIGRGKGRTRETPDGMQAALLGPEFSDEETVESLRKWQASSEWFDDRGRLCRRVAELLDAGRVVGWFQGRSEFGPRALGNRSILADPRPPDMQRRLNMAIKKRESFRPFAPIVSEGEARKWFDLDVPSPYMLITAPVKKQRRHEVIAQDGVSIAEKLGQPRSEIPAVTHVDWSSRVQTVAESNHPLLYRLLGEFDALTGCPVLVNTSFNVRGEPIVNSPADAYRCFMQTDMNDLVIGNRLYTKEAQPLKGRKDIWAQEFASD